MLRTRGKDKKKDTFKKYGKNTTRGLRFKLAQATSGIENTKEQENVQLHGKKCNNKSGR